MAKEKLLLITFTVSKKTGVVAFLMMNGGKLGLLYRKKFERQIDDNSSKVLIYYYGESNASMKDTIKSFETHEGVIKVESIESVDTDDMRSKPRPDVVSA